MDTRTNETSFEKHAIQLSNVGVLELTIKSNLAPSIDCNPGFCEGDFSLLFGHSEFDSDRNGISVGVKLEIGMLDKVDPKQYPFSLRIELVGLFKVDPDNFDVTKIDDWAKRNAPYILLPYLREHAYALTSRCGFTPIILPLFQIPTLYA